MDLEAFVARLALNSNFRQTFLDDPDAALTKAGLELTPPEVKTLIRVAEILNDHGGFDLPGMETMGGAGSGSGSGTGG